MEGTQVAGPRLARHHITLEDGHQVGVAVCGTGIPLVVVHGFTAEGFLYAQTASRLVDMGFKVVTIDTAGHGSTWALPRGGAKLSAYTDLLARAIDELGIEHAILAGHSMGGRLVTELAALRADRTIAVLLLDAIVGEPWDRLIDVSRVAPGLLAVIGALLALDTVSTIPVFRDRAQANKLAKLLLPTVLNDIRRPWRLAQPAISILRSRGTRWMLEQLAQERVPLVAIHGDRDIVVPLATGRSAARMARGELVTVKGGTHSWLLKDPETLPAIVADLLEGRLGDACDAVVEGHGLDPDTASDAEIEHALCAPDALVSRLTPAPTFVVRDAPRPRARYSWTLTDEGAVTSTDSRETGPARAPCLARLLA